MQKEMRTKLVGTTMGVEEGERRQENCRQLQKGQRLHVLYEEDNPFDPNAMKLFADEGKTKPLGYVAKELARDLKEQQGRGWSYEFYCSEVTGGGHKNTGVNIRIVASRAD